jgi:hypothetical protein
MLCQIFLVKACMIILFHFNIWLNLSKVKKLHFESRMHLIKGYSRKKNMRVGMHLFFFIKSIFHARISKYKTEFIGTEMKFTLPGCNSITTTEWFRISKI